MAGARSDRVYHQDYIARIRYSNTLPPPPGPPKLLYIPDPSLSSGQYTSASYASRLAREQPLNIEADAELGMPINLVGLRGVFEGDESIIYGLENPPPSHPHDKPLLRPLSMLGKGAHMAGVSFLRRTEYIATDASQRVEPSKSRLKQDPRKRKRPEFEREDPRRMVEDIMKGFNIAYPQDKAGEIGTHITAEEQRAWDNPRHPSDSSLKVLDAYPMLPDLDALGDTGSYLLTKFVTNPTNPSDVYDMRLDVGLLRPLDLPAEVHEQREALQKAHEADPSLPPPPPPQYEFEYFLPSHDTAARSIKAKFDVNNGENEDANLYDSESKDSGKRFFRYSRIRAYETYKQSGNPSDPYNETLALALHDGDETASSGKRVRLQKAAYIYPIAQRTSIRPKRQAAASQGDEEQSRVDVIELVIRDPDEAEVEQRDVHKSTFSNTTVNDDSAAAMPVAEAAA